MSFRYRLVVLGNVRPRRVNEIKKKIAQLLEYFNLQIGQDIQWLVEPNSIDLRDPVSTAVVFLGGNNADQKHLPALLKNKIPILPVVSEPTQVSQEIPEVLRMLNCLDYNASGAVRVATALLEMVGLLPHQRRIFLSYRRQEAREAALQLFEELSARVFEVFLDTHAIAPSADFQDMLWHQLCDTDVLLMLDTRGYFESRWTKAEFARANAKGITILRVAWPEVKDSPRSTTIPTIQLQTKDIDPDRGKLDGKSISQICAEVEGKRSQGIAVRRLNLANSLQAILKKMDGTVTEIGADRSVYRIEVDDKTIVAQVTLGAPTSVTLYNVYKQSPELPIIVFYSAVGLQKQWLEHLEWMNQEISSLILVNATDENIQWCLSDWSV
jgi:hypothetical protein